MELRHLIALQAVVATGSFNGAAGRLGYTQSAVSAQIRVLERLVGVRVLDRTRGARGVALTREGSILLRYATEIVGRFEAAAAQLLDDGTAEPAAELRVGSFRSASLALAPPALARLAQAQPDLRVSLVERADEDALLELVHERELEVAFAVAPVPPALAAAVLRFEGYVAVLPQGDALASRSELGLGDLRGRRVVVDSTRHGSLLAQSALERGARAVVVVADTTVAAALAAAGVGVALLPELACVAVDGGVVRPLRCELPPRALALAWNADRPRTVAALQFVRAVTNCAHAERTGPLDRPAARVR